MKLNKFFFGTICFMLLGLLSCRNNQEAPATAEKYSTIVLEEQNVELMSTYPATIKGKEDIEIRPRIDGFIDAIYVDEGSVVKKGQSLFKINSPQADQAIKSAQASLKSAQAQVNTAKTNVERIRPLAEQQIVSMVQLTTAEDSYQTALAGLAQAEAALENAAATISWTNVTSPVDGLVGTLPYRLGSLVSSANVLTTVANTSNVFAYFSLNEKELSAFLNTLEGNTQAEKLKNTPEVILTLADESVYGCKGKIETIAGSINTVTGSASFRAEFTNEDGHLRSGVSGKISIPRNLENTLIIPQKATFALQNKVLVYAVQGDSVVRRSISVVSTPDGKNYAVTGGLKNGERIVTDGLASLSNGKKISIQ